MNISILQEETSIPATLHASDDELIQLLCGELHYLLREGIEPHVAGCRECGKRLRALQKSLEAGDPDKTAVHGERAQDEILAFAALKEPDKTLADATFASLDEQFRGLEIGQEQDRFLTWLMTPNRRVWFRACHVYVHAQGEERCTDALLTAMDQLPEAQARMARLHYDLACVLRASDRSFETALPAIERFASATIPNGFILDLSLELLTEPGRIDEIARAADPATVWHGDLRPVERSERVLGVLVELHRDSTRDQTVLISLTLEMVGCGEAKQRSLTVYPAPAFALWRRDDDFRAAEIAAKEAAERALSKAAAESGGESPMPAARMIEVRWRIDSGAGRPWPEKICGPSLGLPFAFLLRRLLAKPDEPVARLNLDGVVFTGAIAADGQVLRVGRIVQKIPEGVHTMVAPRQQIEHPSVTPMDTAELCGVPDTPDILTARGGALHILRVQDVEEAAEMLAVDHATRWQGIDFELPSLPENYVGREALTEEILRFIKHRDSGYGVVVGTIGAGKTAFFKYLIRRLTEQDYRPTFHLIPAQPGTASRGQNVATALYSRLRRKHGTAEPAAWAAWDITQKLEELLKNLSEKNRREGVKEIVIVDAADQAELPPHTELVPNILPAELPPGIICLISSRTDFKRWLGDPEAVAEYFYMHRGMGNRQASTNDWADVREYLLKQEIYQLEPEFIDAIVAQSEPPLFFTVVKRLKELTELGDSTVDGNRRRSLLSQPELWIKPPTKLIRRKIRHILRSVDPHRDVSDLVWQTLGVMALVREPITEQQLRGLGLWHEAVTNRVLREAASFFVPRVEPCGAEEPYCFDHPGYPRVIAEYLRTSGRQRYQQVLAQCCLNWRQFNGATRHYALQHGPAHMRRAEMWQELYEALTDIAYLEERMTPSRSASAGDRATTLPEDLPGWLVSRVLRHFQLALHGQPAFSPSDPRREAIGALYDVIRRQAYVFQQAPELLAQVLHNELVWDWDEDSDLGGKLREAMKSSRRILLKRINQPQTSPDRIRCSFLKGHRKAVNCVALSPDEQIVASASDDGVVILWRVATGEVLRILRSHSAPVRSVAWRHDGRMLASAGQKVRLWDCKTGVCIGELPTKDGAALVAFSPTANLLAVAGNDGSVQLYDTTSRESLGFLRASGPRICAVAFSPDGRLLAVGGADHTGWRGAVELFNLANRTITRTLPKLDYWVGAVFFLPDGKTLATGGGVKKGEVRLFDVESASFQRAFEVHRSGVRSLAFSNLETFVTGSYDSTIGLRDLATGALLSAGMAHSEEVRSVAISRAGDLVVSAGADHAVIVWHLGQAPAIAARRTVAIPKREAHEDRIWTTRFSPDGRYAVTASKDGTARVFDTQARQPCRVFTGRGEDANVAVISPDGCLLAMANRDVVKIFDLQSGAELHCLKGHLNWIIDLVWTHDSARLFSASDDGTTMVWDMRTGRWHRTLKAHTAPLRAVVVSPDGGYAATAGDDAKIHIWDPESGQLVRTLHGHNRHINALAWSHEGLLASAGGDDYIKLWEPLSGREYSTLRVPVQEHWVLAFVSHRFLAAGGKDGMARLFDLHTGSQVACLACRDAIQALWTSADGSEFRGADRGGADLIPNIYVTRLVGPA